jgi:acyl carrier protein
VLRAVSSGVVDIEADLLAILKRVSPRPIEPTVESDLVRDLGFDSLLRMQLTAELEDHFDISIPLNDTGGIRSVAAVRDHLRKLIEASAQRR